MKVTLKIIAEKSGVSIPTVSRILSRKKINYTSKELKVIKIAQDLGYPYISYNENNKKTRHIALILKTGIGEFYSSLFNGFIEASVDTDYQFSMLFLKESNNQINDLIEIINQYDGACIFLTGYNEYDYIKIKDKMIYKPIISIAPIPNPIFNTVTFDSYRGGYLTANYFYNNGYNKVGMICGPKDNTEANNRKNGFIDFINSNLSMKLHWIYEGDYSIESGHKAYTDLKNTNIKNITLFSCNDSMALGFIKEATVNGIKIPEEIKISGYDNLPICKDVTPSLTSIHTDYSKLAKQVILTFEQIINNNISDGHLNLIPIEIISRKSTERT